MKSWEFRYDSESRGDKYALGERIGMSRDGGLGEASLKWTSKYGSVIVSSYESVTIDDMKEA